MTHRHVCLSVPQLISLTILILTYFDTVTKISASSLSLPLSAGGSIIASVAARKEEKEIEIADDHVVDPLHGNPARVRPRPRETLRVTLRVGLRLGLKQELRWHLSLVTP